MSAFADYERYDGLGLKGLIARREVSAEEVLEAAIDRVERRNPGCNAVSQRLYDRARAALRRGPPQGPFAGVPYLLKDLGAQLEGTVTSNGSAFFRDAVAERDSELVARLERAGLVIFGKTNTSELGLSTSAEPRLFGPTRNPWNRERSAGGSSGGAAAAVAARMVPMAHATDGGGSIRIPASACGLFGLKPTRARTPAGPDLGESWNGAGAAHAVTRTVRDSAALLDATQGPDAGDPYPAPPRERPYLDEVGADPGRLRIAVALEAWNGQPVDPACVEAVREAAELCARLGHEVDEASPTWDEAARAKASRVIVAAHTRAALEERAERLGRPVTPGDVEPHVWTMAETGARKTAADYARAVRAMHLAGRALGRFFERWDALLTPTMCARPPPLGVLSMTSPDVEAFNRALLGSIAFTAPFNGSGQPAMSVPLHVGPDGVPIGVQFVGRFGAEGTLFRLAGQLERARPWADRAPPLD